MACACLLKLASVRRELIGLTECVLPDAMLQERQK
jgi:hypothetical protein